MSLTVRKEKSLDDVYDFPQGTKPIASGQFGKVYIVRKKNAPVEEIRVLKIITLSGRAGGEYQDVVDEITALYNIQCTENEIKNNQALGMETKNDTIDNTKITFNSCAIVKIYDWFTVENNSQFCIELEYIAGGDGNQYVKKIRRLKREGQFVQAILNVTRNFGNLVATLNRIHTHCILHRDIKPENLLYKNSPSGSLEDQLIFSDFGLSCFLPQCSQIVGTETFLDPYAVYVKPNIIDERSDIYSLGAAMYEMITGKELNAKLLHRDQYEPNYQNYVEDLDAIARIYQQQIINNPPANINTFEMLAPTVMINAVKKMLIPWQPEERPSLSSILIALVSGRLDEIENFTSQYVCLQSLTQLNQALQKEGRRKTKKGQPIDCTKVTDQQLFAQATKFIQSLFIQSEEEKSDIEAPSDLLYEFEYVYHMSDPCLYRYAARNIDRLFEYYTTINVDQ